MQIDTLTQDRRRRLPYLLSFHGIVTSIPDNSKLLIASCISLGIFITASPYFVGAAVKKYAVSARLR